MKRGLLCSLLCLVFAAPTLAQDAMPETPLDGAPDIPDYLDVPDVSQELPLMDDALSAIFTGKTHRGYYDIYGVRNGENNFSEVMNEDGSTVHTRDGVVSKGRWRTKGPVVCFSYDDDLNGGCFSIYLRGNCHYAYSRSARAFIAVSVIDDAVPTCEKPYV